MISHCWNWLGRMAVVAGLCAALPAKADNLASLFTNLNGPRAAGRPRLPSIIFLECDTLGYLDLSCYGQKQFQTPNLDRLAAGGMMFTNYDAGGADAAESRASVVLGHDAGFAPGRVPTGAVTIGQVLRGGGYHTGMMGEWDLGGQGSGSAPWDNGFDNFAGYFDAGAAANYFSDYMWRYQPRGILNTNNHHWATYVGREPLPKNAGGARGEYIPGLYAHAALEYIQGFEPGRANHFRPLFLWVDFPIARANEAEAARTGNGIQVTTDAPYSEENWPQPAKSKAAMILRLDEYVGQLLDSLKQPGLTNNTAVFFFSATVPRKEAGGVDPLFFPSVTSTNDARLPMIAYWPGHIPAGRVSGHHWSPANLLATAAELGMQNYPTNEVGASILPVLYGKDGTNSISPSK